MKTKTVRTPAIINIAFFALLILPILVFLSIKQVSASTVTIQCQNAFIWYEYNPKLETQCRWKWNFWTRQIKKSYNNK